MMPMSSPEPFETLTFSIALIALYLSVLKPIKGLKIIKKGTVILERNGKEIYSCESNGSSITVPQDGIVYSLLCCFQITGLSVLMVLLSLIPANNQTTQASAKELTSLISKDGMLFSSLNQAIWIGLCGVIFVGLYAASTWLRYQGNESSEADRCASCPHD